MQWTVIILKIGPQNVMPLLPNALASIRDNLERIIKGERVPYTKVGTLTQEQLTTINKYRKKHGLLLISGEIFFIGRHIYESRILEDGYSIEDILDQIASAFDLSATVVNGQKMTAIRNLAKRADRYGNQVRDEVVLECTGHNPKSQLFSVVPRGDDDNKPSKLKKAAIVNGGLVQNLSNSPG